MPVTSHAAHSFLSRCSQQHVALAAQLKAAVSVRAAASRTGTTQLQHDCYSRLGSGVTGSVSGSGSSSSSSSSLTSVKGSSSARVNDAADERGPKWDPSLSSGASKPLPSSPNQLNSLSNASNAEQSAEEELSQDVDFMPEAIVVLAGGQHRDGTVPLWVKRRLDASLELYHNFNAATPIICLGGGTPHMPPVLSPSGHVLHESSSCAQYLLQKGVESHHILKEWGSYDTIANAYFALVWHAIPRHWTDLIIVTSDFHMPRSHLIFEWVFGLQGSGPWRSHPLPPLQSSEQAGGRGEEGSNRGVRDTQEGNGSLKGRLQREPTVAREFPPLLMSSQQSLWREFDPQRTALADVMGLVPSHMQGYRLHYVSVSDEGIDPIVLQFRSRKEMKGIDDLKEKINRIRTLQSFHQFFHVEHKAYNVENQGDFGKRLISDIDPSLLCY